MQEERPKLNLKNIDAYMKSSINHFRWQLENYFENIEDVNISKVHKNISELNKYENIHHLKPLDSSKVMILDEEKVNTDKAERVVLDGKFFWEHAAAGEATRLGLGTKYLLKLNELSIEQIIELRKKEILSDFKENEKKASELIAELTPEKIKSQIGCDPKEILPLNLGTRHMLQMAFDLKKLAEKHKMDPAEVLSKQKVLTILNENTADEIINEWKKFNFFNLNRNTVFFMIQKSFPGITLNSGDLFYDISHDNHHRLHNHGQMVMQKTHEDEIFRINLEGNKEFISTKEFEKLLEDSKDMISYNIEDIGYLTGSIDWHSLAFALELGEQDYAMVMEIVAQNPLKPQKGGACFWDEKKERVVMIESNQLPDVKLENISHLNKNFNHYPNPVIAYRAIKKGEMHLHSDIKTMTDKNGEKKQYIYFCTPQGDINFLVKTAYVMRKNLKPIANWKSAATTPPTIKACFDQDKQEGFKEFVKTIIPDL